MKAKAQKKSISNKVENVVTVICIFVIAACVMGFGCIHAQIKEQNKFSYEKALEETAITVGDEKISLKEVSYYIMVAETNYNEGENLYDGKNLGGFWNMRINRKYFKNMAKETIQESCIRDNIYYQQAKKEGYDLGEESLQLVEDTAVEEMSKLTKDQLERTGYLKKDMILVLTKIQYAREYVSMLMEQGYTQEELDVGGSKYEEIATAYDTDINKEIWDELTIGTVTIGADDEEG